MDLPPRAHTRFGVWPVWRRAAAPWLSPPRATAATSPLATKAKGVNATRQARFVASTMASDAARALECKKRGGEMFAKGKIAAAIEAYSEAICFAPREAVYYTNRAMCHKKRESWDNVVADCEVALGIDSVSIKGHYLMGVALDAQGMHDTAIKHLFRALELCKDQTIAYKEDIQRAMLCSRKRLWQQQRPELEHNLAMTENVLQQALRDRYDGETAALGGVGIQESVRAAALHGEREVLQRTLSDALGKLRAEHGFLRGQQVPDYFCCKITMEIMLDPVCTPDGITYERSAITEHIKKVGKFDPVTRREVEVSQLIPNLGLKEAINDYLGRNPWAYEGVPLT